VKRASRFFPELLQMSLEYIDSDKAKILAGFCKQAMRKKFELDKKNKN